MRLSSKRSSGQSLVEAAAALIVAIPVILFFVDVAIVILCNNAIDHAAKEAARAASSATTATTVAGQAGTGGNWMVGLNAAKAVVQQCASGSGYMQSLKLTYFAYNDTSLHTWGAVPNGLPPDPGTGNCRVVLRMNVAVPVAFPGMSGGPSESSYCCPITAIAP